MVPAGARISAGKFRQRHQVRTFSRRGGRELMAGELDAVAGIPREADDERLPVVSCNGLRARRPTFGGITETHEFLRRLRLFTFVMIWLGLARAVRPQRAADITCCCGLTRRAHVSSIQSSRARRRRLANWLIGACFCLPGFDLGQASRALAGTGGPPHRNRIYRTREMPLWFCVRCNNISQGVRCAIPAQAFASRRQSRRLGGALDSGGFGGYGRVRT